ncbi:MAG: class I SAM-dependent methyltransferase [Anaerolineae bacterium]|nr:class I SAM-dependent methyltransferase [Thermoflexales bacterium]MCX7938799.1 class I SAM-dependent methyltransferase [Thermoflexales bacterium]MDW8053440.1 class I SAM-dependent methyltransferase [Anaerolineae bacterium]MDW8395274.1 class I SAM-dependent methyltransferase [Anaerolineae bacterium]
MSETAICDYEGYDYRTRFWQATDRAYEDAAERIALSSLLPRHGRRLIELGASFGRLAECYAGYEEVILLDYARSGLEQAMQRWGSDPRFYFVVADIYRLPFVAAAFDTAVMVRVMHHIADVPAALRQVRRVLAEGGVFVLEFANKRHLKAMLRYALRRQAWSPYALEPVEFAPLHFDFHPRWMSSKVREAGFQIESSRCVSYLRIGILKRLAPVNFLLMLELLLQRTARLVDLSPSIFWRLRAGSSSKPQKLPPVDSIFRDPRLGQPLRREGNTLVCDADGTRWGIEGRLYDLKTPIA